jgi:ubiquinone/menaquinone biosynthesis C-methylase UbiE
LELDCDRDCRILDAGCGTGLLGLHFLQRYPDGSLTATDLEPNFLEAAEANAVRRGLPTGRITWGIANISTPHQVRQRDGQPLELADEAFDLICVGAVLGYADDTKQSLGHLVRLLRPGGYLVNLEMNEGIGGRFVSHRYHYRNLPIAQIREVLQRAGCEVQEKPFRASHFPAKLTRMAIIARKST